MVLKAFVFRRICMITIYSNLQYEKSPHRRLDNNWDGYSSPQEDIFQTESNSRSSGKNLLQFICRLQYGRSMDWRYLQDLSRKIWRRPVVGICARSEICRRPQCTR